MARQGQLNGSDASSARPHCAHSPYRTLPSASKALATFSALHEPFLAHVADRRIPVATLGDQAAVGYLVLFKWRRRVFSSVRSRNLQCRAGRPGCFAFPRA